jgi:hypothetical protein
VGHVAVGCSRVSTPKQTRAKETNVRRSTRAAHPLWFKARRLPPRACRRASYRADRNQDLAKRICSGNPHRISSAITIAEYLLVLRRVRWARIALLTKQREIDLVPTGLERLVRYKRQGSRAANGRRKPKYAFLTRFDSSIFQTVAIKIIRRKVRSLTGVVR